MISIRGYCVTESLPTMKSRYTGIANYAAWPLSNLCDAESSAFSDKQFQYWLDNPYSDLILVDDICFIKEYTLQCIERGISVQVFYLSNELSFQERVLQQKQFPVYVFCGWDYLASLDASYLFDDGDAVFKTSKDQLSYIAKRLTPYGLFATIEDAKCYAKLRKKVASPSDKLELLGHEYFVGVYTVSI